MQGKYAKKAFCFFFLTCLMLLLCCRVEAVDFLFFTGDCRSAYLQNEIIEFGIYSEKKLNEIPLVIIAKLQNEDKKGELVLYKDKISTEKIKTLLFQMPARYLKPGDYEIIAKIGDSIRKLDIKIISTNPVSHFLSGFNGPESVDFTSRISENGGNFFLIHVYQYAKIDQMKNFGPEESFGIPDPLPLMNIEKVLNETMSNNIFVGDYTSWSGYVIHQPFTNWTSWNDPEIFKLAMQVIQLKAQRLRRFPNVKWAGPLDEPGLGYGLDINGNLSSGWPDHFQKEAFEKETGIKLPENIFELSDGDWLKFYRWRCGIIGRFMNYAKKYFKEVPHNIAWAPDIYAGWAINDGAYPLNGRSSEWRNTHGFADFDGGKQAMMAHLALERAGWQKHPFSVATNVHLSFEPEPRNPLTYWMLSNLILTQGIDSNWFLNYDQKHLEFMKGPNERNIRFGDFFKEITPKNNVAILYSISESALRLKKYGDDREKIYEIARSYTCEVLSLYQSLTRAHYPADIVLEEEIKEGILNNYKVLWMPGITQPAVYQEISEYLNQFISHGGKIIKTRNTISFVPGISTEVDYSSSYRKIRCLDKEAEEFFNAGDYTTGSYKRLNIWKDQIIDEQVPEIRNVMKKIIGPPIIEFEKQDTSIILQHQQSGEGRYLQVINYNQQIPEKPDILYKTKDGKEQQVYQLDYFADYRNKFKINGLKSRESVYVLEGLELNKGRKLKNPEQFLDFYFEPAEMKLLAILPEAIGHLKLFVAHEVLQADLMKVKVCIFSVHNNLIRAPIPLEIEIIDSKGRVRYHLYRSTNKIGIYEEDLQVSFNDEPGLWQIKVRELFSGMEICRKIVVKEKDRKVFFSNAPDVSVYDKKTIKKFFKEKKIIWIISGWKATETEKRVVEEIGDFLRKSGFVVEIKNEENVLQKSFYPKVFPVFENRNGKFVFLSEKEREKLKKPWEKLFQWTGAKGYPPTLPDAYYVPENIIVIGKDQTSKIINILQRSMILMRVTNYYYPGSGRGIIQYAWSPFTLDKDAILITGSDDEGIEKAAKKLISIARGKE